MNKLLTRSLNKTRYLEVLSNPIRQSGRRLVSRPPKSNNRNRATKQLTSKPLLLFIAGFFREVTGLSIRTKAKEKAQMAASKVDSLLSRELAAVDHTVMQSSSSFVGRSASQDTTQHDGNNAQAAGSYPAVTPQSKELRDRTSVLNDSAASLESRYELPRCEAPPAAEMEPIEKFVVNAMLSQEPGGSEQSRDPSHAEGYREIISALKRPSDPPILRKLLLALRTAGTGSVLNQLALGSNHAQLVHFIIRFNPTSAPINYEEIFAGDDHDAKLKVYEDYSLCDAHFHLLLAMVSAKSTHVQPVLAAVWKILTKFGPIEDEKM